MAEKPTFSFEDDPEAAEKQEAADILQADAGPRKRGPGRPRKIPAAAPPKGRVAAHGSLEGPIKATMMIVATTWEKADPVCGKAFREAYPTIAQQLSIMADADAKTHEFVNNLLMRGGLGLFLAVLPVATTVVNHHITEPARRRREAENAENAPDSLTNTG